MISDAYVTAADYRSRVFKSDAGSDADIDADLLMVSRLLDKELGRFFTKDDTPQTRVFLPPNSYRVIGNLAPFGWAESENPYRYGVYIRDLKVTDMAAPPTQVIIDQDGDGNFANDPPLDSTQLNADAPEIFADYEVHPFNAPKGPEPQPYHTLIIPPWSKVGGFPMAHRVLVTAVWGWPAVPPAIVRATIELCGILRIESPRATQRVTEFSSLSEMSPEAAGIVERLKKQYKNTASVV